MARDQAKYVISLPSLPDDVHVDAKGRYPRDRAVAAEYAWPYYGNPQRVAVGENTYVGANEKVAVNWWKGSDIHNRTATNPAYREVGIAAIKHPWGHLYVVVFGARPSVFPVSIDIEKSQMYVPSERYQYATGGDWLANVQQVQLLASALSQMEDDQWVAWNQEITLPNLNAFALAFRDGSKTVILQVDPMVNVLWLPSNMDRLLNEGITVSNGEVSTGTTGTTTVSTPRFFPTNTPAP
jgi:hypothetical protein